MVLPADAVIAVVPVEHISVRTDTPFSQVVERLEAETGLFHSADVGRRLTAGESPASVIDAIEAMAGSSGFMRFLAADHGAILRLQGRPADAIRFLIGHPLIAAQMTRRAIGSALYAPLSLLVVSDGEGTRLEYDRPSSVFAQFHEPEVGNVA